MATEYCRSMLRICIAQLCQNLGWNATQSSPLELLTDILERYLIDLGKISHRYSEQFGRTEPNLDDLALTFRHYGIQLGELEDYIRHVEPVAFAQEVVSFPARKCNSLGFPNSRSRELLQHREEHVHNHLPYMYPGMEDEVEEETSQASSLPTPQLPQESVSPMAISPTPSDKRPLSNSAEGPPSKRPRLTSSNLPEEAGHSQYEMKSLLMNTSGVLTPTRQGKLPDARTPPTFRQSLQFKDDGGQKGRENKEETPKRPPFSEKSGRQEEEDNRDKSNNCLEKVAPKKKMLKHYKQMTAADSAGGMPRSPKITKLARSPKPGSPIGTKSPKPKQKVKSKEKNVKREEIGIGSNLPNESCLKDLLLSPKVNVDKVEKTRVGSPMSASPKVKSESKEKCQDKKDKKSRVDSQEKQRPISDAQSRHLGDGEMPPGKSELEVSSQLPFNVEEESSISGGDSPERLFIAEGDAKVKNTKEARQARLALIDDSIDSVIRNYSVAEVEKKTDTFSFIEDSDIRMSPKPGKGKKKDKSRSGKDSDKPRKKEKKEKSDSQSITDSIDAVIRQSSEETELVPQPAPVSAVTEVSSMDVPELPPLVKTSPTVIHEPVSKKIGKDKLDKKQKKKTSGKKKDKEGFLKDRLKDKIKHKSDKLDFLETEKKPSVLDKFSAQEYSVYDFPESPPTLPPPRKSTPKSGTSPKQVLPPSNIPHPPTPLQTPPPLVASAQPPTAKEEPPSTPVGDQPPIMTLKILDLKHKQKGKERSKDKEHKKEKKEKKKDKEKKKKNKDKDKEKSRDKSKSREEKHREDKDLPSSSPVGGIVAPIKLNIKFGGSSAATSTVITEPKITSPKPEPVPVSPKTPRSELLLSPKREIPKLVIKPIRRESLEAKAKLGAAARSPAIMSPPPKSPSPPAPPPAPTTPLVQKPPTPPSPAPVPPPPQSQVSPPPPPPKIKTPPKSPSPPPSPPRPKTPPPSPPPLTPSPPPLTPSPPPPPRSPTPISRSPTPPPHRSPTPEKLLTPSPEPKQHSPPISPVRKSPTPEPSPPPRKSPTPVEQSPPVSSPSPRRASSPKPSPPPPPSPPSSPPPSSPHLEMDIDKDDEPETKPKPKPKPSKQSPKGKGDKSDTKPSPKGKRGRKPKEDKHDKEEPKPGVRSRNKSIPTVTSETVSETPITGPIVQRTVVAETIGTFLDAEGNKVWICPACKMQDDGSPMIGCDVCDDWYHWVCMDIKQEPDEDEWFCPRCEESRAKSKTPRGKPKGKKRGRKKKI